MAMRNIAAGLSFVGCSLSAITHTPTSSGSFMRAMGLIAPAASSLFAFSSRYFTTAWHDCGFGEEGDELTCANDSRRGLCWLVLVV